MRRTLLPGMRSTSGHRLQSIMAAASIIGIVAQVGQESATKTTFPLRLTGDLKALATAQAARAGISLNQYIATVPAAHVGAQSEAERMFAARAARPGPNDSGAGRQTAAPRVGESAECRMNCIGAEQPHCCAVPPCAMTIRRHEVRYVSRS
jgi:hypothetical protein